MQTETLSDTALIPDWPQTVYIVRVDPTADHVWTEAEAAVFVGLWCVLGNRAGEPLRGDERMQRMELDDMSIAFSSTDDPATTPMGRIIAAHARPAGGIDLAFQPAQAMKRPESLLGKLFGRLGALEVMEAT